MGQVGEVEEWIGVGVGGYKIFCLLLDELG